VSLRLTEAEYAAYLRRGQPAPVSEAAFQAAVVRLAKQYGWLAYFTWSSKRSPEGYPDLTLAKAGQPLYLCELKREDGQVTPAQAAWLEALGQCTGVVAEIWRPAQLEEIVARLRDYSPSPMSRTSAGECKAIRDRL
jgi:hypothetical protein